MYAVGDRVRLWDGSAARVEGVVVRSEGARGPRVEYRVVDVDRDESFRVWPQDITGPA